MYVFLQNCQVENNQDVSSLSILVQVKNDYNPVNGVSEWRPHLQKIDLPRTEYK